MKHTTHRGEKYCGIIFIYLLLDTVTKRFSIIRLFARFETQFNAIFEMLWTEMDQISKISHVEEFLDCDLVSSLHISWTHASLLSTYMVGASK